MKMSVRGSYRKLKMKMLQGILLRIHRRKFFEKLRKRSRHRKEIRGKMKGPYEKLKHKFMLRKRILKLKAKKLKLLSEFKNKYVQRKRTGCFFIANKLRDIPRIFYSKRRYRFILKIKKKKNKKKFKKKLKNKGIFYNPYFIKTSKISEEEDGLYFRIFRSDLAMTIKDILAYYEIKPSITYHYMINRNPLTQRSTNTFRFKARRVIKILDHCLCQPGLNFYRKSLYVRKVKNRGYFHNKRLLFMPKPLKRFSKYFPYIRFKKTQTQGLKLNHPKPKANNLNRRETNFMSIYDNSK